MKNSVFQSRKSALISSKAFSGFMRFFSSVFNSFRNVSKYHYFKAQNSDFQRKWKKEGKKQNLIFQCLDNPKIYHVFKFLRFRCYLSEEKTDVVQVFKSIFSFSGMNFQIFATNLSFRCNSAESWENLNFFKYFAYHFVHFHFMTTLSLFIVFICTCRYQS